MSDTISPKALKVGVPKAFAGVTATPPLDRLTLGQQIAFAFARPHIALPLVIVSMALLTWSAVTYTNSRALVANARPRPTVTPDAVVTPEAVAELDREARSAAAQLIHDRGTI